MAAIAGDGIYRIYRIDVDADTRGTPWYQDLAMNSLAQSVNAPTPAEVFSSGSTLGQGPP